MIFAALVLTQTSKPPEVSQLVRQVRAAYRNCGAYRDVGTQVIWNIDKSRTKTIWGQWKFATIFARPQLRLEVSERKNGAWVSSVLWTDKSTTKLFIGIDRSVQTVDLLRSGLMSLTTLCFGIADRVPFLLLPLIEQYDLFEELEWKAGAPTKVRGRDCYVLVSRDSSMKLWIDRRSSLLVQIHESTDHGGGRRTLKIVEYTPTLNTKVQQSEFKGPAAYGN